ncbi:hypothetical protein OS493_038989 [Desmophyllum pertusum]|uniref:SLED domain-containing protein n=1 Tax=Desmophyllum pertusum TaxID=174260 RepID=A0A9X0D802_9CNID|nr:hypothetical protein OS493_038989 [Desmophyllum pertusum]
MFKLPTGNCGSARLKPGMKLEAVDRTILPHSCRYSNTTGWAEVRIRYDGFGKDSSNDCWCNFQAEELHPIGCVRRMATLSNHQKQINFDICLFEFCLIDVDSLIPLYSADSRAFPAKSSWFEIGMKLEAVHPMKPSIICPATVTKSLGPYYFSVTTDYQEDVPPVTFVAIVTRQGFSLQDGCSRHQVDLSVPAIPVSGTICPPHLFRKMKSHKFKPGMKLEVADLEQPQIIRVTTITKHHGQKCCNCSLMANQSFSLWILNHQTSIPLVGVKGRDTLSIRLLAQFLLKQPASADDEDSLDLPSFSSVMGRQNQAQSGQPAVGLLPRKIPTVSKTERMTSHLARKVTSVMMIQVQSVFTTTRTRYSSNKSCCYGPLLDPNKVSQLPEATPPGKVSSVIRTGMEMVAKAALTLKRS